MGSYAYVDAGVESDVQKFIWDTTDNKWVQARRVVTQDITPAQVKSLYESNADTNAFTDNEQSKLAGIQVGAEKNPTPLTNAQIKTQYEANTNTNAYTDAEKTKLSGIAVGAQVNPYTKTELDTKYDSKVDKVTGKQLSTNDYTTTEKTKLSGIATGAQVNPTGSQIKTLYEGNNDTNAFTDAEKVLVGKINDKVDKETGKQLSDQNFTLAEKSKLAGLESSKYIGQFTTKAALDAVTGTTGSYGYVDAGAGTDVKIYIWDTTDNKWVEGGGAVENLTPAQIKTMYESNADTNVFSDTEKSKLSNIEAGAQKNLAPLTNAEIKTKYEANSNTNAFTDAEKTKLTGIQAGAQVNTVTSVAGKTGAVALAKADVGLGSVQNYAIASKTQAESGTSNVLYMTPLRNKRVNNSRYGRYRKCVRRNIRSVILDVSSR